MGGVFSSSADECCETAQQRRKDLEECQNNLFTKRQLAGGDIACLKNLIANLKQSRQLIENLQRLQDNSNTNDIIKLLQGYQTGFLALDFDLEKYCQYFESREESYQELVTRAAAQS